MHDENMVGLNCYQSKYDSNGVKTLFEVKPGCQSNDSVEKGCYVFVRKPIKNLGRDLDAFNEWGFRFNFFYALCRGVLSQSFTTVYFLTTSTHHSSTYYLINIFISHY
jgi:hypothetical protein